MKPSGASVLVHPAAHGTPVHLIRRLEEMVGEVDSLVVVASFKGGGAQVMHSDLSPQALSWASLVLLHYGGRFAWAEPDEAVPDEPSV